MRNTAFFLIGKNSIYLQRKVRAGYFSAVIIACRRGPAAAQCFVQADRRLQPVEADLRQLVLRIEERALSIEHRQQIVRPFAGALGDVDQHDVHRAYAAHQLRYRRDRARQYGQRVLRLGRGLEQRCHVADLVIGRAVTGEQQGLDSALRLINARNIFDRHGGINPI